MTVQSRTMLGVALTPVLAMALAAPTAFAAPTAATAAPDPAQDAASTAAASNAPVQLGPWTKPTRLDRSITKMVTAQNGTVVALSGDTVLRRPAGATGWLPMGFKLSRATPLAGLTALPDGSVQLTWWDESLSTDTHAWTAMLAPGATEFSAAQHFVAPYDADVAGSASGHVVAAWYREGKVYASERTAQGTWSAPALLATAAEPHYAGDVSLAVANDGTALVSWGGTLVWGEGRRYQTMEKAAGAAQWSAPRDLALAGSNPQIVQLFAHPKGGFHMVWNGRSDTALSYARRAAGTTSWSPAELVGTGTAHRVNAPMVLPNGDVVLVGSNRVPWYSVRSEAKGTWAATQRFPSPRAVYHTVHSVLAANGTVAAVWSRVGDGRDRAWASTFAGGTWSAPTLLSEAHNWDFEMTVDGQGRPLVAFGQIEDVDGVSHTAGYLTTTATRKLPVRRDLTGDGVADVLGLSTAGNLKAFSGTALTAAPFTVPGWDPATEILPFGDLNGDRCNDVFARMPGGEVRVYTPVCGGLPSPGSAYKKIASDWSGYNSFSAPGDLTGDGRTDLLARDAATGNLYLYADNGAGGFAARVKTGWGWNTYKKIIGAGDLTGDGKADLLALDGSGELWRYDGTGNGAGIFKSRVLVFKDWGSTYKDVVGAGDVNRDGKADLISRDGSGRPWLNEGNGAGGFGNRIAIAAEPVWQFTKVS